MADKGPYSQSQGFSSSHIQMWNLDHKEGWVPKNWCFQIVVLGKKLLRAPWTAKRSNRSILKEINPEYSLEGLKQKLKLQYFVKSWFIGKYPDAGKNWGQEEKGAAEGEMVGWHHRHKGLECLGKLRETVKDREARCTTDHGVAKGQTWLSDWTTRLSQFAPLLLCLFCGF